ncbi:hypothetical protein QX204_14040 [Nocardia sp. PE-7]|uniref:hypothetical protein n=1 Tax=Nocardia sp. PE-7 TaxID=3058426 RepID=UPI0026588CD4|nr:hypothetical protein [Nocardia sp. PE-7]WKG12520.1 hypothetical protein QX204_14040 [Nocardia sp. PE-7]
MTMLASGVIREMGTDPVNAVLRFGSESAAAPSRAPGQRLLFVDDRPAFELSSWCGTCPMLFERKEGANRTLSVPEFATRVAVGLDELDDSVIDAFGELLPAGRYQPMLLGIEPRLVHPLDRDDYFAHEQVETWGIDSFWGLPAHPRTIYYRTFETAVSADAHLYEFVVPMVPPTWNDATRVAQFDERLRSVSTPTAVAVSILDVCQPAVADESRDYYTHYSLIHFLLDGHHKLEAAAKAGRPLRLLSLLSVDAGLADKHDIASLAGIRSGMPGERR